MACTTNLFDTLTPAGQAGGTWSQTSGPQAVVLTGGHLGTIDASSLLSGTYVFEYNGPTGCGGTSEVTVTINDGAVAGTSATVALCGNDNTEYNLYDQLGNTPLPSTGGTWSGNTTGVTVGTPADTNTTFNPFGLTGTFVHTYTANNGDATTPVDCDNCVATATVTFTVDDPFNAGGNGAITLCNQP
jgi:hypothetical protein